MAVDKFRLSPQALEDLADIWRYTLSEWSIEQADRYIDKLNEAFGQFAQNHYLMRDAGHIRSGYFSFPCGRHVLYGRHEGDVLIIIRILHERMDHSRWL